jgi:hypothetical protein
MTWTDIRRHYPHQWLLIEALLAHSKSGKRQLDEMAVVDAFTDGETALRSYLRLPGAWPGLRRGGPDLPWAKPSPR